jgi:release factor glutamine methyltransferase
MRSQLDKWLTTTLLKPIIGWYLRKDRWYRHPLLSQGLLVKAGVFHPSFFFSSEFFADFANRQLVMDKRVCEMGAGSGLLSFLMLQKGAVVTSIERSQVALSGLLFNKQHCNCPERLSIVASDMFDAVNEPPFDFIFINPPYFFKSPATEVQLAWYAGPSGEFFDRFFSQLKKQVHAQSQIYMVLADNCDLAAIENIASVHKWQMKVVYSRKIRWEINSIFQISPQ